MTDGKKYDPESMDISSMYPEESDRISLKKMAIIHGADLDDSKLGDAFDINSTYSANAREIMDADYAAERFEREYFEEIDGDDTVSRAAGDARIDAFVREELIREDLSEDETVLMGVGDESLLDFIRKATGLDPNVDPSDYWAKQQYADMEFSTPEERKKMDIPKPKPPVKRPEETVQKRENRGKRSRPASKKPAPKVLTQDEKDNKAFDSNPDHQWIIDAFVFGGSMYCKCGNAPVNSQEDVNNHIREVARPKKAFELRDHLTERPLQQHEGLKALAEQLRKQS